MEFLTESGAYLSTAVSYLVPFLFVLSIVVVIHELGHFLVARWCGVRVEAFSLGFGPELLAWVDRRGTRWRLAAIPLGGYVKFLGDSNAASMPEGSAVETLTPAERKVSFPAQPIWKRAAIVAAGPFANFLLAIAVFAGIFLAYGKTTTAPRVDAVEAGTPAEQAGFKPGDVIASIDGTPIQSFTDMQRIVAGSGGAALAVTVIRDGQEIKLEAVPQMREERDPLGNPGSRWVLGIQRSPTPGEVVVERPGLIRAVALGTQETWYVVSRTIGYIGGIFAGKESADQLGGPMRILKVSGQVAGIGFSALMNLVAVLSVSIGLLNLFPIPLLDGGHLMFYLVEAVRGRPLSERAQEYGLRIGLALVVGLMLFATWNDILFFRAS